jgi:hypothetical protein
MNRGWLQQTPCSCLDAPRHQPDCTGRNGVLVLGDRHGRSLLEQLWEELDAVVDRLLEPGAVAEDGRDPGRAEGVAFAIALIRNRNGTPDIQAVRSEAMERRARRVAA